MSPRSGKRRSRDADASRRRLMDAGTHEFAAHGFEAATLDRIAGRARVNKAMVAYYFGDKRGLYQAILDAMITEVVRHAQIDIAADLAPDARLKAYIGILSRAVTARPDFPAMLLREYLSGWFASQPELVERLSQLTRLTQEILRDKAYRKVDAQLFHLTLMGSIALFAATQDLRKAARARSSLPLTNASNDAFADHLATLCLEGLRPKTSR